MKQIAFTWLLCILSICAYAQQITVTGTVTDAENNPLIGAAGVVVVTTDGVITDFDGKYTIKAASGQSLNFSYVGYQEQTVKVDGRSVINVKLSEGELLDEVVVIGYGTVKKSHLTGAVASVSGKELQANVARSASAALQGRVAGVTVSAANGQSGEGLNINVRGISSLSATSPLYVIDGVYGDINMVDPADIQSIEVLKDASAAAIMAADLYELSMYSNKAKYKETADKVMHSLSSSDYRSKIGENHNFLLMHSVGSYPHGNEIDVPLIYADYYFLEALKRKRDCDIEAKSKSVQK